jgi:hypothetical protein
MWETPFVASVISAVRWSSLIQGSEIRPPTTESD